MTAGFRPAVRTAALAEGETLARLAGSALSGLGLAAWLVTDGEARLSIISAYAQVLIEHAIMHGTVHTVEDHAGVAVWLPFPGPDIAGHDEYRRQICGAFVKRFCALDVAMRAAHPAHQRHEHLLLVAVRPDRQGFGIADALLRHRHAELDDLRAPACLHVPTPGLARFFRSRGYAPIRHLWGPSGSDVRLRSMWRTPQPLSAERMA